MAERLDSPELREKIVEWLYNGLSIDDLITPNGTFTDDPDIRKEWVYKMAHQLLALIPDEKAECEACADGFISTHEKETNEIRAIKDAECRARVEELIDKALPDFSAQKREKGHPESYWAGYHYARGLIRHHWQALKKKC